MDERKVRGLVIGGSGIFLLLASLYFFLLSLELVSGAVQNITASLLSALIGFSLLSAGVTLLRSWALARAAESAEARE